MSIATEISRIQQAKADIKSSIEAKGVTVPSAALIDDYSDYVDAIQTGGGGSNQEFIDLIECDITSLNIPSGTTSIGSYVFMYQKTLTSVTIPNTVTRIKNDAFIYCESLSSINIPNSVTRIEDEAFYECYGLTSVTIGNGITYIGFSTFDECPLLTSITINATTPPLIDSSTFNNFSGTIYVPAASVDAYKAANNWSTYASRIQAIPSE